MKNRALLAVLIGCLGGLVAGFTSRPAVATGLDESSSDALEVGGSCVPDDGSCKGPGKKCCHYCCSGTCQKHANCSN